MIQGLLQCVYSNALRYPTHKAVVVFNFKIFELSWETGLGVRTILHELNYHCTVKSAMQFNTKGPALLWHLVCWQGAVLLSVSVITCIPEMLMSALARSSLETAEIKPPILDLNSQMHNWAAAGLLVWEKRRKKEKEYFVTWSRFVSNALGVNIA